jgi:hypothetical protein
MKNFVTKSALIAGSLATMLAMSSTAFAAGSGDGSNASPCGAAHGAFADVNGNFGFLGAAGGTPGYHDGAVGQDPGATGFNNSHTSCHDTAPSPS